MNWGWAGVKSSNFSEIPDIVKITPKKANRVITCIKFRIIYHFGYARFFKHDFKVDYPRLLMI